jgi:hypothetical protein
VSEPREGSTAASAQRNAVAFPTKDLPWEVKTRAISTPAPSYEQRERFLNQVSERSEKLSAARAV